MCVVLQVKHFLKYFYKNWRFLYFMNFKANKNTNIIKGSVYPISCWYRFLDGHYTFYTEFFNFRHILRIRKSMTLWSRSIETCQLNCSFHIVYIRIRRCKHSYPEPQPRKLSLPFLVAIFLRKYKKYLYSIFATFHYIILSEIMFFVYLYSFLNRFWSLVPNLGSKFRGEKMGDILIFLVNSAGFCGFYSIK